MKNYKLFLYLIIVVAFFASCTGIYEDGNELAEAYSSKVTEISVDELKSLIDEGGEFVLIDVRQPIEHFTNNIPGSVLLPRGELEFKIGDEDFWFDQYLYPPDDTTAIVIYCKSGKRGILAATTLLQLGYKNVVNLKNGYDAFNPNQDPDAKPQISGGCGG
jgi:sulfur dioxygenase